MQGLSIETHLTESDLKQIESRGVPLSQIARQLGAFKKGAPYLELNRACSIGDGIREISSQEVKEYTQKFNEAQKSGQVAKFVPASGAASRMFRSLLTINNVYDQIDKRMLETDDPDKEKNLGEFRTFIQNIHHFACVHDLKKVLDRDFSESLEDLLSKGEYKKILRTILDPDGLNYANIPKALIPFHNYADGPRTSLEEHLSEALEYTKDKKQNCRVHFTVSESFLKKVEQQIDTLKRKYHKLDANMHIKISTQSPSSDTIATDIEGTPFRDEEGDLIFRPGGHGSLLSNLNSIEEEIVFIKNIDNVVHESRRNPTYVSKKILGGMLVHYQAKCHNILRTLETLSDTPEKKPGFVEEALRFCREDLSISIPENQSPKQLIQTLFQKLNRPIRVCGMVKNEGEPGGGPFWAKDPNGQLSLQIVESSQINLESENQYKILKTSQYFNPVDLVCGLKNYKGQKFDLNNYVDHNTYFITVKSYRGKPLQAYEHPGLWNGSMANWITLFAEIPVETFAPVKQFNDLLNPSHTEKK